MPINRIVASLVLVHVANELARVRDCISQCANQSRIREQEVIMLTRKMHMIERDQYASHDDYIECIEERDQWIGYLSESIESWQMYTSEEGILIPMHNSLLSAITDDQAEYETNSIQRDVIVASST